MKNLITLLLFFSLSSFAKSRADSVSVQKSFSNHHLDVKITFDQTDADFKIRDILSNILTNQFDQETESITSVKVTLSVLGKGKVSTKVSGTNSEIKAKAKDIVLSLIEDLRKVLD